MPVSITFLSPERQKSQFDWVDISLGEVRVGKARCKRFFAPGRSRLVIYSIIIYPEWAGQGYGRAFIDYCKRNFEEIIADRVRHTAIGFWQAMGFRDNGDGCWIYGQGG